jgi:hypothetical protein
VRGSRSGLRRGPLSCAILADPVPQAARSRRVRSAAPARWVPPVRGSARACRPPGATVSIRRTHSRFVARIACRFMVGALRAARVITGGLGRQGGAKRAMLRRANARSRTQPRREHTWTFLGVPPGWGPRSAPPIRRRGGGAAAGTGPAGPAVTADPCNAAQGVAAWSPDDSRSRGHSYQWAPAVRRMSRNKNVSHPMGYRTPSRPGPSAEQAPGPLRRTAVLTGTFLDIDVPEASHSSDAYCSGRGAAARGRMVGRPRPGPRSHPRPTESQ